MKRWIFLLLVSSQLNASPTDQLSKVGEGSMSYLFWTLYSAELFTNSRSTDLEELGETALKITYRREISKDALVEATKDQWLHLGYSSQRIEQWVPVLMQIWPSVKPGDQLMLHIDDGNISRFYLNQNELGRVKDPEFGLAFIAIWLSEKTSEPKLRKQLLGLMP